MRQLMEGRLRTIFGRPSGAGFSAWTAHLLAWGVGLWLAFGPVYQGTTATAVEIDPSSGQVIGTSVPEVTAHTASLIDINGIQAAIYLLVPIALTGLSIMAVRLKGVRRPVRKTAQWLTAIALLIGCALAMASIGIFYLPSALALIASAFLRLPRRPEGVDGPV